MRRVAITVHGETREHIILDAHCYEVIQALDVLHCNGIVQCYSIGGLEEPSVVAATDAGTYRTRP